LIHANPEFELDIKDMSIRLDDGKGKNDLGSDLLFSLFGD